MVSHNSHSILNICDYSIYLEKGRLIASGTTEKVITKYEEDLALISAEDDRTSSLKLPPKPPEESSGLDVSEIFFRDRQERVLDNPLSGEPAILCVKCHSQIHLDRLNLGVKVRKVLGEQDLVLYLTAASDRCLLQVSPGMVELQLGLPYCGLVPGKYTARIYLRDGVCSYDVIESFRFTVKTAAVTSQCQFYQPRTWNVKPLKLGVA